MMAGGLVGGARRRLASVLGGVVGVFAAQCAAGLDAQAAYTFTFHEDRGNVVGTGGGSFNLDGLAVAGPLAGMSAGVYAETLFLSLGPAEDLWMHRGLTGPTSFGGWGPFVQTAVFSGPGINILHTVSYGPVLGLPLGYTSGDLVANSVAFLGTTFAAMGVTPGTYVWRWGSGADADSFTVRFATPSTVPAPGAAVVLGVGLFAVGLARRSGGAA